MGKLVVLIIVLILGIWQVESCEENLMKVEIFCSEYHNRTYGFANWLNMRVYECYSLKQNIGSRAPNAKVTSVVDANGPVSESDRAKIESLYIGESKIDFIPGGIKAMFPNLKVFIVKNSELLVVRAEDLRQFGNSLEMLTIAYTEITSLDRNVLDNNPNLIVIEFYGNKRLKYIDPALIASFKSMKKAKYIDFQMSACISQTFDDRRDEIGSFVWNSQGCLDQIAVLLTKFVELLGQNLQSLNNESCMKRQIRHNNCKIDSVENKLDKLIEKVGLIL